MHKHHLACPRYIGGASDGMFLPKIFPASSSCQSSCQKCLLDTRAAFFFVLSSFIRVKDKQESLYPHLKRSSGKVEAWIAEQILKNNLKQIMLLEPVFWQIDLSSSGWRLWQSWRRKVHLSKHWLQWHSLPQDGNCCRPDEGNSICRNQQSSLFFVVFNCLFIDSSPDLAAMLFLSTLGVEMIAACRWTFS